MSDITYLLMFIGADGIEPDAVSQDVEKLKEIATNNSSGDTVIWSKQNANSWIGHFDFDDDEDEQEDHHYVIEPIKTI